MQGKCVIQVRGSESATQQTVDGSSTHFSLSFSRSLSVLFNSVKRTESYLFFKLLAYVTKECAELKCTYIMSFKKCEDLLCSSSWL